MRNLSIVFIFLLCASTAYTQTDKDRAEWANSIIGESKPASVQATDRILRFNFGPMWTRVHDNDSVLGYIGNDYQRLRIVILSATKQPGKSDTYNVTGKSMVRNVVRPFSGTLKITHASSSTDVEEDYKADKVKESGYVFGEYHLAEDAKQTSTGKFDGKFVTYWIIDKDGKLQYDEVMMGADSWSNNQFAGIWTSYRSNVAKPASWGDSRIPVSGDLDIGASEFAPDEKYVKNGWEGYRDAYSKQNERALAEERRPWWK